MIVGAGVHASHILATLRRALKYGLEAGEMGGIEAVFFPEGFEGGDEACAKDFVREGYAIPVVDR